MDIRDVVHFVCSICKKRHDRMFGNYVGVNYTCSFNCERAQRAIDFQFISVPPNPPNTPTSLPTPTTPRRKN